MRLALAARFVGACGVVVALGGCGGALLPSQSEVGSTSFESYGAVHAAFDHIALKQSSVGDLSDLGFDAQHAPNVAVLSYLEIVERFMPNSSMAFDRLDPAVQDCILARDGCQGYVFKVEHRETQRSGSLFLDVFGFEHTTTETGWNAQVLVLVQNGKVTHKLLSGEPNLRVVREQVQPLGPLQDLAGLFGTGTSIAARSIK
ncbi:MAG TPA: hypothetical protein VG387_19055 [Rhizomicrobium sp.]|jgi:hypothetical protein|nr:hypothetical protein [Rhizomicrobium sp.]